MHLNGGGQHPSGAAHCHGLAKAGLVDHRAEIVLTRQAKGPVVLGQPGHRQLQRALGVEAGRPRIGIRHALRPPGRIMQRGPLGLLKEGEVAQLEFSAEGAVLERRK